MPISYSMRKPINGSNFNFSQYSNIFLQNYPLSFLHQGLNRQLPFVGDFSKVISWAVVLASKPRSVNQQIPTCRKSSDIYFSDILPHASETLQAGAAKQGIFLIFFSIFSGKHTGSISPIKVSINSFFFVGASSTRILQVVALEIG